MRLESLLDEALEACRSLHAQGLLAAADGNVSLRLEDGRVAITPRGVAKATLRREDFAFLDLDGTIFSGHPSSERLMHLAVYRTCPEAKAVVHAHPVTAIAWSLAHPDADELPPTRCRKSSSPLAAFLSSPWPRRGPRPWGRSSPPTCQPTA